MNNNVLKTFKTVDYIIVGGGIAGLYAAWNLRKREPLASIVVLEGSQLLGGRAKTKYFAGMHVPTGAGIGRSRDVKLKALVRDLGLGPIEERPKHVYLQAELAPLRSRWQGLWRRVLKQIPKYVSQCHVHQTTCTFEDALYAILGEEDAAVFILLSGYTDFLQAHAMDVVNWYGMQDNAPLTSVGGDNIFYVKWDKVIEALVEGIGIENIRTGAVVTRVRGGRVECRDGRQSLVWQARKHIYVGVPGPQLKYLFRQHEPLKYLGNQPFVRVYAVLEKAIEGLKGYTVVGNELQKVIPMSADGRVVMIAYADNEDARSCWKAAASYNKRWFETRLNAAFHLEGRSRVKIARMWHKYWYVGTHFFTHGDVSLHELQRVSHRISLIGEAVSHKQGWVEGALESVDNVLRV